MIWYTHSVKDENGTPLIHDIDIALEVEVSLAGGSPEMEIRGVWIDDTDLLKSKSPTIRAIACQIVEDAENDDDTVERALEDAGIVYRGLGGNDPDGHWIRRREPE